MCWELYQTLQRNRMEDRELDMFAWFLDELYDGMCPLWCVQCD